MDHLKAVKRAENVNLKNVARKAYQAIVASNLVVNKKSLLKNWITNRKKEAIVEISGGIKLRTNNIKKEITLLLSLYEIFKKEIYPVPSSNKEAIILDIGANIGLFSLYAMTKNRKATVYAFEPDPENFERLQKNIQLNGFNNSIIPFQKAISQNEGNLSLYRDRVSSRGHSLVYQAGEPITVDSSTLEKVFENLKIAKCAILKMDAEGAEYAIFFNTPDCILEKIDSIFLECHRGIEDRNSSYHQESLKQFLENKGFNIIQEKGNILHAARLQ